MAVARTREARVFGFALDSSGNPLRGQVSLTASARSGAPALPPRTVQPDDTGVFEFTNVPPGEYVLRAASGSALAPTVSMPRTDFVQAPPGLHPSASAQSGELDALRARVGTAQQELQRVARLMRRGIEYASQFITVDGTELPPVTIATVPPAILTGRVVFEGSLAGAGPGDFGMVTVPEPDDGPIGTGSIVPAEDGSFELAASGAFRLSSGNVPRGWWLKSVLVAGTNAVETPVRLSGPGDSRADVVAVFSSETGSIGGRVGDDRGDPVADYRVVAFPTDRARWFGKSPYVRITAGPEGDGGFTIGTLPPGDYYVVAVDRLEGDGAAGEWQNPDVLAVLSASASRISLAANQRAALSLRLVRRQP
jgi:hypothetical protein